MGLSMVPSVFSWPGPGEPSKTQKDLEGDPRKKGEDERNHSAHDSESVNEAKAMPPHTNLSGSKAAWIRPPLVTKGSPCHWATRDWQSHQKRPINQLILLSHQPIHKTYTFAGTPQSTLLGTQPRRMHSAQSIESGMQSQEALFSSHIKDSRTLLVRHPIRCPQSLRHRSLKCTRILFARIPSYRRAIMSNFMYRWNVGTS